MRNLAKYIVGIICLAFFIIPDLHAQGEINEEPRIFYRNERSFAGNLYTNGWAVNFRYAKRRDAFRSFTIDADLANLRHPKEYRSQSPYLMGWGNSYVFGKLNDVYLLRAGVGIQQELFDKVDQGGISIRYFANAGLTLGLLKPVYYLKISYDPVTYEVITQESRFDPDYMQTIYDIYDSEPFYKGITEVRVDPGIFARVGLCFEYSSEDNKIRAIEGGVQLEGFLNEVPIMASSDNRQLFLSLFAGYRFGRVLDARFDTQ